jgi:glycosyltransferase involved in cell wall biosynthesis
MFNYKVSVIVPLFNEEKTIIKVLKKIYDIKKNYKELEIIVVNDGSTDGSKKLLDENNDLYDVLISYDKNKGKGHAVKNGIKSANGKYIIFQDADLEYDPIDFIKFFKIIDKFEPDLIIGSRFNYADYTRSHHFFNKIGNMCITFIFNLFYQTTFTDVYSCYACFKRELLDHHNLKSNGFEQHAEILCKVVKKGKTFYEVPINYNGRTHEEGKKIKFYHIFSVIYQIVIGRFI